MPYDRMKYFRRRQFVLGPEFIDYPGWKRLRVDEGFLLTVHPDLHTTVVGENENKAVLLGYAIDPFQPELDDEGILRRFIHDRISLSDIISSLETLSGRFVILVRSKEFLFLFHDACGLRQVHHCRDKQGAIWCASQAETLAERFGFAYDEETLSYRNMPAFRLSLEDFALIGERTPFSEIKYLLANHYLDLRQGTIHRYWPAPGCIGSLSVDESIRLRRPILQNSIKVAAQRYDLKMGITAGCDSRKSLGAAKNVKDKIYFFTYEPTASHKVDIEVPARLLRKLGIKHHLLELHHMSPEFRKYYECSATWARERIGHLAYTGLKEFGPGATVLNSNISEYSQVQYWLPKSKIDGEGLAILKGLNHPIAISDFQKWLDSSQSACKAANMNVLVLFQLELRGRWVANTFAECDIAYETFNPYNNRRLYCLELSVNERRRRGRRLDFPIKLIKSMWPEILAEPINPEERVFGKIREFILRFVIHKTITPWLPVIDYLRYIKFKRQFKDQIKERR